MRFFQSHGDAEIGDIQNFIEKFGFLKNNTPTHLTKRKLRERLACMREELDEFEKAIEQQDLPEQIDALIDLVYFAKGTAVMLGVGHLWTRCWAEVQRANMSKIRGITKRNQKADVTKPEDWIAPRIPYILAKEGYDRTQFMNSRSFNEELCSDDEVANEA